MPIRIGINGFGRIGRCVLRAVYELERKDVEVVALNATGPLEGTAHFLRFDSVHGRFPAKVETQGSDTLLVNGDRIRTFSTRDPHEINWGDCGVDVVMECTGAFRTGESNQVHLERGAKKVLISAPGKGVDATIVYGVNDATLKASDRIVSNGSCTTNCLAPFARALDAAIGIERGLMTTVHSYTNDQVLIDARHKDLRRARSATQSMIPTKTGAAAAVGLVLPQLKGKLDGFAVRVPTIDVSFCDLTFVPSREVTVDEVNAAVREAAKDPSYHGVLGCNTLPLVSCDFAHDDRSSIFDETLTKVSEGQLVKACAWYDNEWGFSCRMLDVACAMMAAK